MKISGNFEVSVTGDDNGKGAPVHQDWIQQPFCIALGDPDGMLLPGTRLTKDMSIHECRDVLAALKVRYPNAGMYLSAVVDGRPAQELKDDEPLSLSFFQVVHDITEAGRRCLGMPLGRRWERDVDARAELPKLKETNPGAYVARSTVFCSKDELDEYQTLRATVIPAV